MTGVGLERHFPPPWSIEEQSASYVNREIERALLVIRIGELRDNTCKLTSLTPIQSNGRGA
jgi:hypothetical protein